MSEGITRAPQTGQYATKSRFLQALPYAAKAAHFIWWPFFKVFNAVISSRFPSTRGAPADLPYVDDGRYDYDLSQPAYGIKFEKKIDIPMRDGIKLRGDIFRPDAPGRFPVIMAEAPYPRYINIQPGADDNGGVGTKYQQFEQAYPEYWVSRGYVYITFSTRGYGGSEGRTATLDYQEAVDYYDAIEWTATQPWSNGNVGLYGISYYAMFQYFVAGLQPPSLKAMVPWEGLADPYRDVAYRGGILCRFGLIFALGMQLIANNPFVSKDYLKLLLSHPLCDDLWEYGMGVLSQGKRSTPMMLRLISEIEVPMLSVGNLNDPDLHLRGNVNAFIAARSPEKKLLLYSGTHWGSAFQPWANRTVLRFFDQYLKGIDTGIEGEPAVDVELRTGPDTFTHIYGDSWPLEQTQWTNYYLDARKKTLSIAEPEEGASVVAEWHSDPEVGSSHQVTFLTEPLARDIQIAGPLTAHFCVSSSLRDVDLTVEVRDFDENSRETRFAYAIAGMRDEPVTRGWLRASLRALDPERTTPHQPFYLFTGNDWLAPGVPVPLDVEIWPTGMLFKAGHRIGLTIHCGRYKRKGEVYFHGKPLSFLPALTLRLAAYQAFSPKPGTTNIHTGNDYPSWLELPEILSSPAPKHQIVIQDGSFLPERASGWMGNFFEWTNAGEDYHSVTESSGLDFWDSQLIRGRRSHNPETWWMRIPWAGTFSYCDMVSGFTGSIAIPVNVQPSAAAGGQANVDLGAAPLPEGIGFDVQLLEVDGAWKTIHEGICDTRIIIGPLSSGSYAVRSRLRRLDIDKTAACTDWSPPVEIQVK